MARLLGIIDQTAEPGVTAGFVFQRCSFLHAKRQFKEIGSRWSNLLSPCSCLREPVGPCNELSSFFFLPVFPRTVPPLYSISLRTGSTRIFVPVESWWNTVLFVQRPVHRDERPTPALRRSIGQLSTVSLGRWLIRRKFASLY